MFPFDMRQYNEYHYNTNKFSKVEIKYGYLFV